MSMALQIRSLDIYFRQLQSPSHLTPHPPLYPPSSSLCRATTNTLGKHQRIRGSRSLSINTTPLSRSAGNLLDHVEMHQVNSRFIFPRYVRQSALPFGHEKHVFDPWSQAYWHIAPRSPRGFQRPLFTLAPVCCSLHSYLTLY